MTVDKVGVVGAGLMGSEIALVFALAGKQVLLNDVSDENLARAVDGLGRIVDRGVQRGFYKAERKAQALGRITTTTDLARYADRDLVIEAVFEDESVKAETFRKLDLLCRDECIIASNTSSISISGLASHVKHARRGRFLGMHFFSPVSRISWWR